MNNPQIYLLLGISLFCIGLYGMLTGKNRHCLLVSMMYIATGLEIDLISLSLFGIIPVRGLVMGILILLLFFIQLSVAFGLLFYFRNPHAGHGKVME